MAFVNPRVVIVPINPLSDGDPSHLPTKVGCSQVNPPTLYLEKLARLWMEHRGEAQRGITYRLDRLPHGYMMWEKPRINQPKHIDKWLYGHPGHKFFDSPNRFFPHFLHLMNHGHSIACPCTVCTNPNPKPKPKPKTRLGPRETNTNQKSPYFQETPKPRGRPAVLDRPKKFDDEGTPDVYRALIDELKIRKVIDKPIVENFSMDWRTERPLAKSLESRSSWCPRVGEIVLFVRRLVPGEQIQYQSQKHKFAIFDTSREVFIKNVPWEAGVVTQVPDEGCSLDISQLTAEPQKEEYLVNYSGFRVEPLPDPQGKDKSASTQHCYIHLHQTRPFCLWKELLQNVSEDQYHATISHAQDLMGTFSLVEKYHFKGSWPSASIDCKGIYMSSELLLLGDVVRLIPKPNHQNVETLLKITAIRLEFSGLHQASDDDYDDGHPYNSAVIVYGVGFEKQSNISNNKTSFTVDGSSTNFLDLDDEHLWIPKHDHTKRMKVSFNRILGRHFGDSAMKAWLPQDVSPNRLDCGLGGVLGARRASQLNDHRITDGKKWYWAESRSDALALRTFNGVEVSFYDEERDPKERRKYIKVIEGVAGENERQAVNDKAAAQESLRTFSMFRYKPAEESDVMSGLESGLDSGQPSGLQSRKRSHSVMSGSVGAGAGFGSGTRPGSRIDEYAEELE